MPITLNSTTIDSGANGNWTLTGGSSNLADGGVPPKEGSNCLEFEIDNNNANGGVYLTTAFTAINIANQEVGCWFLNPKGDADGNELIGTGATDLRLRLYSGGSTTNYMDFGQGHLRQSDGTYPGGWSFLRASGAHNQTTGNVIESGTFNSASVDRIGVIVYNQFGNGGKNETEYAVDIARYYNKIVITGYNGGTTPWTLQDIFDESETNAWGVVEKTENFYKFYCGLEFGDGTNAGAFVAENEYIYFEPSSSDHDYDFVVRNNFTVTLGEKNVQTDDTYAQNGCQLVCAESALFPLATAVKCAPPLTVQSGGILQLYDTLVRGFGTINLGSGGSSAIELIGCDLYDNDEVEFRSTGLTADDIRIHHLSTDKGDLGAIYSIPSSMKRIQVFNCTDALDVRDTMSIEEYKAGDTTYDVVVLEGETLTLVNSTFNENKIKRST